MITNIIKQRLATLKIDSAEAIIVGSSALAALGLHKQSDIDIMVPRPTFQRVASIGYAVSQYTDGSGQIVVGDTELMHSFHGKVFDDYLPQAMLIDGIRFMSLTDMRAWKQVQNRPKDWRDIELIDDYLRNHSC
jgi:hypothetical protein